jgi:signal transduction histidine kinase
VAVNLISNGIKYTPEGGRVTVSLVRTGDDAELRVRDTGIGIPAEHLPHIFDRFYKADASRAGVTGGSGLGLSIVKAIVERHGGTISVASRPGRTVFEMVLPTTALG